MGVYHVSGLGLSPGALTVPLSSVYILLSAAQLGHTEAMRFFQFSGERRKKGSYEMVRGLPENIVILDSPEAIEGKLRLNYSSNWFRMSSSKPESIHKPVVSLLCRLIGILEPLGVNLKEPKRMYLLKTNHTDFEDAFFKAGITIEALRDKEVWVNLIGGSNQINLALMMAGAYTVIPSRYYYLFQDKITLLEPAWDGMKRPGNERELFRAADIILDRWYNFPPLNLGIGIILRELYLHFHRAGKVEVITKEKVEEILRERGYSEVNMFIPKLIGSGYLVPRDSSSFEKGPLLDRTVEMFLGIEQSGIRNFTQWAKWGKENDYLVEVNFEC